MAAPPRFTRLERAGEGGSADVYRAVDVLRGGEVALKVARDDVGREALAREAKHAALTASPLLPQLVAAGFLRLCDGAAFVADEAEGRAFVALRWTEGVRLDDVRGPHEREALALVVARDVADALSELHGLGAAHGDVGARNVLVGDDGRAHLLDLGLVGPAFAPHVEGGTLRYLALRDTELGNGRERDMLALGVVLAELVEPRVAGAETAVEAARALARRGPGQGGTR